MAANWSTSADILRNVAAGCVGLSANVVTIGMAGSFGRLEGSMQSDADFIMIVHDSESAAVPRDREIVRKAIASCGIAEPNATGVFAEARTKAELTDTIGSKDEKVDQLSKRMLLLLESRPIFEPDAFSQLVEEIFEKYTNYITRDGNKEFTLLLNDLIRYFRTICVSYEFTFWNENEKWALRNLKLRHSRVIMYAGLLLLLGEASKYRGNSKVRVVGDRLPLTPLQRIAWVYEQNNDTAITRLLGLYNVFLARLSNEQWRTALRGVDYEDRFSSPEFAELKANSDALIGELYRFIMSRRGSWSERFFEYMFF